MTTFENLGLGQEICSAIQKLGFVNPTPIQEKTIPNILENNNDIIALAQTGTGKTAAFGLPIIESLDDSINNIQALILCPTRELCMQISKDIESYSSNKKLLKVTAIYGGADITRQINTLKKGCHVVAGTPGRVLDLIHRKVLKINEIKWLVLDEADEMLSMGFKDDLDSILAETPKEKRTLLFSATLPKEIKSIANRYMNNSVEISVGKRNAGAENISHIYYMVNARDRYEVLKRIADLNPNIYGIIFCRTRQETKEVADKLMNNGYNADALHGDLSQAQRDFIMKRFRQKHLQLLVATDVAARGLDVENLTHIINYNLPDDLEVYTHRSGRTGRAGKDGISICIIHSREKNKIKEIEKLTGKPFERKMVPDGKQICEKQLFNLIDKVEKVEVNNSVIDEYLPVIFKKLSWLDREDLIRHFVSIEFNRFLDEYKDAPDLNIPDNKSDTFERRRSNEYERRRSNESERRRNRNNERAKSISNSNFSRFYINIGSKNGVNAALLMGIINENTRTRDIEIGKIDIMKGFSFFEIDKSFETKIIESFQNAKYNDVKLLVELSKPDKNKQTGEKQSRGGYPKKDYAKKDYSNKRASNKEESNRYYDKKPKRKRV